MLHRLLGRLRSLEKVGEVPGAVETSRSFLLKMTHGEGCGRVVQLHD